MAEVITLKDEESQPSVLLGIACNKNQVPGFWIPLLAAHGPVTHFAWSENGLAELKEPDILRRPMSHRSAMTDSNRNKLTEILLYETDCDYIFFLDDDVRIAFSLEVTINRLMSHEYAICSSIYYRGCDPFGPLMFMMDAEDDPREGYTHLIDWEPDSLMRVDVVGMGATLIHRNVFERMRDELAVVENWRGEYRLEHPDDLKQNMAPSCRVVDKNDLPEYAKFPWFVMSHGRTEDMYFCENARRLGYNIWMDTSVELEHLHVLPIHRGHFLKARELHEKEDANVVWRRQ